MRFGNVNATLKNVESSDVLIYKLMSETISVRFISIVKWFNDKEGYGFIEQLFSFPMK